MTKVSLSRVYPNSQIQSLWQCWHLSGDCTYWFHNWRAHHARWCLSQLPLLWQSMWTLAARARAGSSLRWTVSDNSMFIRRRHEKSSISMKTTLHEIWARWICLSDHGTASLIVLHPHQITWLKNAHWLCEVTAVIWFILLSFHVLLSILQLFRFNPVRFQGWWHHRNCATACPSAVQMANIHIQKVWHGKTVRHCKDMPLSSISSSLFTPLEYLGLLVMCANPWSWAAYCGPLSETTVSGIPCLAKKINFRWLMASEEPILSSLVISA